MEVGGFVERLKILQVLVGCRFRFRMAVGISSGVILSDMLRTMQDKVGVACSARLLEVSVKGLVRKT